VCVCVSYVCSVSEGLERPTYLFRDSSLFSFYVFYSISANYMPWAERLITLRNVCLDKTPLSLLQKDLLRLLSL